MKPAKIIQIVCLLVVVILAQPVAAQDEPPTERDMAFEQDIYNRLTVIAPAAVPIFQEATRAMDAGDFDTARVGYLKVLEMAPGFPDAARRLSYVELELGNIDAAIEYARQAYEADPSSPNRLVLARALLATEERANASEALKYAQEVVRVLPDDPEANSVLLYASVIVGHKNSIRQASMTLVRVAPDFPVGHYFAGLMKAEDGAWEEAERELKTAQALGMPAEYVQEALDSGIAKQARFRRWIRWGEYSFIGWLISLGGLFAAGVVLSHLTLATTRRMRPTSQFQVGIGARLLRTIYRIVIILTTIYFYISIPVLIAMVIVAAGSIFYMMLSSGSLQLLINGIASLAIGALAIFFIVRMTLFIRPREQEPGPLISREKAPQLWAMAEEVAAHVGTRPVDAIYFGALTDIGVKERGSLREILRGAGQRCLLLGLGALPGMNQGQFKAILAHEYGHFLGRDTVGGRLARRVETSICGLGEILTSSQQARWYNPIWLFISGYYRVFLRVTLGASRLQEILADQYAVTAYGTQNFVSALEHIARQDLLFQARAFQEISEAQEQERPCRNFYTLPPFEAGIEGEIDAQIEKILSRPTSLYDTHPAIKERIARLAEIDESTPSDEHSAAAWDLLPDAMMWQERMSRLISANVGALRTGIAIIQSLKLYQSKSAPAEASILSLQQKVLRMWGHIGTRRVLWTSLVCVLGIVNLGLLDATLSGEMSAIFLMISVILFVTCGVFMFAPRAVFVPCSTLYPMNEAQYSMLFITGNLYLSRLSGKHDFDTFLTQGYDPHFSLVSKHFPDMPCDLIIGKEKQLILFIMREVRHDRTGQSITIAAPTAQFPMIEPQYWGVNIKSDEILEVCPGILAGRWDRPALCFTYRAYHKNKQVYVAFSNYLTYERVLSFLQHKGIQVAPPIGLVLPATENSVTSGGESISLFRM